MSSSESRQVPAPFRVGQRVRYTPSERGHALDVNALPAGRLERGRIYRITAIQKASYILVEGYEHPGGGIYWTEFSPINEGSDT